jgi:hypothetical protein
MCNTPGGVWNEEELPQQWTESIPVSFDGFSTVHHGIE